MRAEHASAALEQTIYPEIHELVILDRAVDMITPMAVQLTYEGLVDELMGVRSGSTGFQYCGRALL